MKETLVDLIRHGEPVGGRRYRGNGTDDPLSELGWEQMWRAVEGHHPWHQVITSPLARCREFATHLASGYGLPLAVEQELREVGMGSWEGRTPRQVQTEHPEEFEAFYRDPVNRRPPGGESLASLEERVGRAYDTAVATHPDRHLLLVVHAGVMRALVGRVLGAQPARWYRLRIDYAGVVRIRHGRFGAALECVNARRVR
ncbi:MAG: alpha-ribazole phosphatase family protein [Pseudomonadota bacterium]|nr:alpha-ribazole phosphatase family protein [Pseudomonadota bacterium]